MHARGRALLLLPLAIAAGMACGSRSDLDDVESGSTGGAGHGGAGGSGGSGGAGAGGGGAGGSGGQVECSALSVEPIAWAPGPSLVHTPQIALLPPSGNVVVSFLSAMKGEPGPLFAVRADAFGAWPPVFDEVTLLQDGVARYAVGPGPSGPVAVVHPIAEPALLATTFFPQIVDAEVPLSAIDEVLFATAIPDRYLFAHAAVQSEYNVFHLGSYQPGSLPQSEQPLVCVTSTVLGAGVPSGAGFLAAYVEPDPPEPGCDVQAPLPGSVVSISRYEAPPGAGTFLERTQGERFFPFEPAVHLGLAPASFGGWVVFQTDGSTARVPPPVVAARVSASGDALVPGELIAVTPGGYIPPEVTVAALGDTLAVAWIDAIDPSAPVIAVQLVRPDGTLGPATSFPTFEAWFSGNLEILPSAGGDSLLLAWESAFEGEVSQIALGRIDCVNTP